MAESREYMTLPEEKGNIHIAEEVIAAISVGAVREVEGVSGMMVGGSVADLAGGKKSAQKNVRGVKIHMGDAAMTLDVYLAVKYGYPIPEVAARVQNAVGSSVEAMTGCCVNAVNVHISGVMLA